MPRRDAYEKALVPMAGGIHREFDTYEPGKGWWTISGFHTNELGAFTKFPGLQQDTSLPGRVDGLYQAKLGLSTFKFGFGDGEVWRIDPNYELLLASGLTPAAVDGRTLSNRFFFGNGIDVNRKIAFDSINLKVQNMGIVAPTTAPTIDISGAGSLTGEYSYRYTYYNSESDIESDPSPAGTFSATSDALDVLDLVASADPQVDKIRIYRTVADGAVWLRLTEIPNGQPSHDADNAADSTLGAEVRQDNGPPPIAKYFEVYNGMMALAGIPDQTSTVAMSAVLRPESFDPDDIYDLDPEELDTITGLARYGQSLAVGKRNGLYLGTGVHPTFMNFVRTRVTQGPLGNFSIIPYEGFLYYLSEKGPYVFNGLQETYIGQPIEAIYKTLDLAAIARSTGVFYPNLNMFMWNVTTTGKFSPDLLLVFNIITKEWTTRPIDTTWMSTYLDAQSRVRWWLGSSTGQVSTGDVGFGDYGTVVTGDIVSRGINFPKVPVANVKNYRHLFVDYEPNGSAIPVEVSYSVDTPNGPFLSAGTFTPATGRKKRFDINAKGNVLFVKLSVSSTDPLVVRNLDVWGHDLGRIR